MARLTRRRLLRASSWGLEGGLLELMVGGSLRSAVRIKMRDQISAGLAPEIAKVTRSLAHLLSTLEVEGLVELFYGSILKRPPPGRGRASSAGPAWAVGFFGGAVAPPCDGRW